MLTHIRELMHKACPDIEETIKWGMPFFTLHGVIVGNMAAFKQHCSLGLWGPEMAAMLGNDGAMSDQAMGTFGRIDEREGPAGDEGAAGVLQTGGGAGGERGADEVAAAQDEAEGGEACSGGSGGAGGGAEEEQEAAEVFEAFSPSCKKEYVEWIAEAKREETKPKRVAQAVEWMAEGKQRNWKYQNC